MSVWRNVDTKEEVVVCDNCGITEHGNYDVSMLVKIDHGKEMVNAGFPEGTDCVVTDYCPSCGDIVRRENCDARTGRRCNCGDKEIFTYKKRRGLDAGLR